MAEGVVVHLLLRGSWVAWAATALHAYGVMWLWAFALGPRAYPHRVGPRGAVLRGGAMYRVRVPREAVAGVTVRTERAGEGTQLVERDGAVLLASRGRVDLWLELSEPVRVQRPLHEPLETCRLAVASDDPERLAALLRAPAAVVDAARGGRRARAGGGVVGALVALDLAGAARDAAQPA